MFAFPRTDDSHEFLEFAAFQRQIDVAEALAEHVVQRRAFFELGQRFKQSTRQLMRVSIGVADDGRAMREIVLHAEIAARQARGERQIGIGIGAGEARFRRAALSSGEIGTRRPAERLS